jgi:calcineurin-like phosphoesterase family protein
MIWFTGDEHFDHREIIRYCNRPFKSKDEMNNVIIKRFNEVVNVNDTVWHIGDFSMYGAERAHFFRSMMKKYKEGVNHHLVLGNHDEASAFFYVKIGFTTVHTAMPMEIAGIKFVLAHDPAVYCAIDKNTVLLCGHIHTLFKTLPENRVINVGVDAWNFYPINLEQILAEVNKWGSIKS